MRNPLATNGISDLAAEWGVPALLRSGSFSHLRFVVWPVGMSRDTIGQAKGVIMERFNHDAVEAFELPTRLSQRSNTKLIDIAKALIDSEHPLKPRHRGPQA